MTVTAARGAHFAGGRFARTEGWTVASARRRLSDLFAAAGLDTPDLDAAILAGHALGLDRARLAAASARPLGPAEMDRIEEVAARRLGREPVARIVGVKEFWGLPIRLGPAALVPRPDTETVVEAALAALAADGRRADNLRVADLGTGSGALLLALLAELPRAFGVGTDLSLSALALARGNARALGLENRARFLACDFGQALRGGFDVVVSNPPYVRSAEIDSLAPEVRDHDPRLALDGGVDGLACFRAIASDAHRLVERGGHLLIEIGAGQAAEVAALFDDGAFFAPEIRRDLSGTNRVLHAKRKR